jgi:hypothetical protein
VTPALDSRSGTESGKVSHSASRSGGSGVTIGSWGECGGGGSYGDGGTGGSYGEGGGGGSWGVGTGGSVKFGRPLCGFESGIMYLIVHIKKQGLADSVPLSFTNSIQLDRRMS